MITAISKYIFHFAVVVEIMGQVKVFVYLAELFWSDRPRYCQSVTSVSRFASKLH